jgi:hypothetical protein
LFSSLRGTCEFAWVLIILISSCKFDPKYCRVRPAMDVGVRAVKGSESPGCVPMPCGRGFVPLANGTPRAQIRLCGPLANNKQ